MAKPPTFLAIDLGATAGRLVLGRLKRGRLQVQEAHRFQNVPIRYNGELHWDIPRLWSEIQAGLEAVSAAGVEHVDAMGVDTWGVDYALLTEDGSLLENPYHYRDVRVDGVMERVLELAGADRIYRDTGIQFLPINTLYQLYAAQQKSPRLLAAADALVTIPDLLNLWLSGVLACEYTNATTTQFLAHSTRMWASDLLRELDLPTHFLTRVIPPGTVLGGLREDVGAGPAFARCTVVAPACHDTGSAVASIETGECTAFLKCGTWSLLGAEVPRPVVTPEARKLNFTNEGGVCGTIRLLKNITGYWLLEGCRRRWKAEGRDHTWSELLAMAAEAEPARSFVDPDDPVFVRPADMTQAVAQFCLHTGQPAPRTMGEFVRTILESLAMKYRRVLDELGCVTGTQFSALRTIGRGARNPLLNQMIADITRRTVIGGPVDAAPLGNIAMQMLACGAVRNLAEARSIIQRSQPTQCYTPSDAGTWDSAYGLFSGIALDAGAIHRTSRVL